MPLDTAHCFNLHRYLDTCLLVVRSTFIGIENVHSIQCLLPGVQQRTNLCQGKEHLHHVLLGYGGDQANGESECHKQRTG